MPGKTRRLGISGDLADTCGPARKRAHSNR